MKKVVAFVCGLFFASSVFAVDDFVARIPTGNVALVNYFQLTAWLRLVPENQGKNIICKVYVNNDVNGQPIAVQFQALNYVLQKGDTPDGIYQIGKSQTFNYVKYDITPYTGGTNSYINILNVDNTDGNNVVANCGFF